MGTLDKLFYVNVGKGGTFKPSGNQEYDTTAQDIDKIFTSLKEKNQRKLLLYFHGGLVNAVDGMDTATRIVRYSAAASSSHPICFVWETGLMETLSQNLHTINNSAFFKKLLIKIIKVAGKQLGIDINDAFSGGKGVGSMSEAEILIQLQREAPFEEVSENAGKRSVLLNATAAQIDNNIYYEAVVKPEVYADMEAEISDDQVLVDLASAEKPPREAALMKNELADSTVNGQKGILSFAKLITAAVKITVAVIKRHMKKRDHGFYPTIVEEIFREIYIADIGTWVWGRMKHKAKQMWKEDDFSGDPQDWHVGTYLLKKIEEYQDEVGELTIDLLGHSAGSIAICELIDAIHKKNIGLKFRNIFFMAPACRCELFADTILQHKELFRKIRIFTMLDEYEKKDHLVPMLYPRSLLYFISGVLEENAFDAYVLGLQRHISGNKPYNEDTVLNEINNYLKLDDRMVYAVTADDAGEGMRSGSIRHGDFDNDKEPTLDSIFYLLKQ